MESRDPLPIWWIASDDDGEFDDGWDDDWDDDYCDGSYYCDCEDCWFWRHT